MVHFIQNRFIVKYYQLHAFSFKSNYLLERIYISYYSLLSNPNAQYQRTNGPVNAHLRSAVYTNVIENMPSIGAGEALGPLFFQNNQYTVHTNFSLQMTF